MFPAAFLDELRTRADLVSYVSRAVPLVRSGAAWRGRCPFHEDRTPSFSVRADPPTFRCFGCEARGDIFAFVMRRKRLSFPEAVRHVAKAFGINMPWEPARTLPGSEHTAPDSDLIDVLRAAAEHFQAVLWSDAGAPARDYLAGRGLVRETLEQLGAGAAAGRRNALIAALAPRFGMKLLERAGLVHGNAQRGFHDRFRNRVILPVQDEKGTVVGFGARSIDQTLPKYLNSRASSLYQKGRLLYGLPWATQAAKGTGRLVLVEGYLDAALALQAGVPDTAALCGTALTAHHARLVRRLASRVLLCLDQDAAGIQATRRGLLSSLEQSLDARIVLLPPGHDPASYCQTAGGDAFRRLLDTAVPALEWLIRWSAELHDTSTPPGKAAFFSALVPYLARIQSPVERAAWARSAAPSGDLDEGAAREQLAASIERRPATSPRGAVTEYVWASSTGVHGTPLLEDLETRGWTRVAAHHWYADTWLLERHWPGAPRSGAARSSLGSLDNWQYHGSMGPLG